MVVADAGGVRKLRVALPGRGKSGSARIIYLYVAPDARVYFLLVYRKSARETLSDAEKKHLAARAPYGRDNEGACNRKPTTSRSATRLSAGH